MVSPPEANRVEPGSVDLKGLTYPEAVEEPNPTPENADKIATGIIDKLNGALGKDPKAVADLFCKVPFWRDHLASSFEYRTVKGRDGISQFLEENPNVTNVEIRRGTDFQAPSFGPLVGLGDPQGITTIVSFKSKLGSGRGCVRILNEGEGYKIWAMFLCLEELAKGPSEPLGANRPQGVSHGAQTDRRNWQARRNDDHDFKNSEPTVVIVGGGQAAIMLAARLKMQGVSTLAFDVYNRVGDSWRRRYEQLVLHDPVWYDHMPYLPFPKHWPVFSPKDKIAEWFEAYVNALELNVWVQTNLVSSKYDEKEGKWTVELDRTLPDGKTERRTFHPRHVVQATGHSGKPKMPSIKGMDNFKGHSLCHSSAHPGGRKDGKGKKAIVVGACNSSHDICQDFYEKGYDVTMVQRSTSCIVSSYAITDIALAGLYEENGPDTEDADVWLFGMPAEMFKTQQARVGAIQNDHDKETLEGLEKAGFRLDSGPGGGGLFVKYYQRGGGYYIDVGGSKLIVDGKVKVKGGQEIDEVLPNGLKFADGDVIEADEIIFATGYQNMRTQCRAIFGDKVADRVGDYWGFDKEGEFRMQARPTGHPGFWMIGGNMALNRWYSRTLALQIKAIENGMATQDGKVALK